MRQTRKIPTILGIIVLLIGVAAGVGLTQYSAIFRLRAAPDTVPTDVRITNITDTSFSISWTTAKPTLANLSWGTTASVNEIQPQEDTALTDVHYFTLKDLSPSTLYFFKISSSGNIYDNNGIPWQARTGKALSASTNTQVISGTLKEASGAVAPNAVVYINSGSMGSLSAKTTSNGSFVIPLSKARSSDVNQAASLVANSLLQVLAVGGARGVATAQVYLSGTNPIAPMTLGQTYDLRGTSSTDNNVPKSQLSIPPSTQSQSRIQLDSSSSASQTTTTVTLKSVNEGEIITTQDPEFFGDGPPGTNLTIIVESDPQTTTLPVSTSGTWKWNPPQNLAPGTHKITISWKDAGGILRLLTRSFVVSAQEGPAFESSGSATTPTPIPTETPFPTLTPSTPMPTIIATASATPSASPRVSIPATDSGTPVAGVSTPTMLMLISGFLFISISIIFAIKG